MIVIVRQFEDNTRQYSVVQDDGSVEAVMPLTTLDDLPTAQNARVIIVLPGAQVHMLSVTLPKMSNNELQQAVPNMLEEQLSQDINQLYFAIGVPNDNNLRHVAITDKTRWDALISELKEHNIKPSLILPDYLCLPLSEHSWSLYMDTAMIMVRTGLQSGFSTDRALFELSLSLTLQECEQRPQQLHVGIEPNATAAKLDVDIPAQTIKNSFEALIDVNTLIEHSPFNLLQNQIRQKRHKTQQRSYWSWCRLSVTVFIAVLFLGQVGLFIDLKTKSSHLNHQLLSLYQQAFPGATQLVEPKFRIEQLVKEYELSANPFVSILQRVATINAHMSAITINAITYTDNAMTLVISARSNTSINAFNKALTNTGLSIKKNQTQTKNKTVIETLTVGLS
ncbi:MAG: hypothetical protein COB66_01740 [Coxiella sp. (in: Bacteria)]|nr:MAG: hypothetical protein COB66_01740 [Coxiella sp. (in: g-proteobacteria)]